VPVPIVSRVRHSIVQGAGVGKLRLVTRKRKIHNLSPFEHCMGTAPRSRELLRRTQALTILSHVTNTPANYTVLSYLVQIHRIPHPFLSVLRSALYCISPLTSSPTPESNSAGISQRRAEYVCVQMWNLHGEELFSVTCRLAKYDSQSPRTKNHSPHLRYL
jgi:hypothetical protein